MSEVIQLLQLEHQRIASVLSALDEQLRHLEANETVDFPLLLLALDYLSGFPHACHHPKEDLVFRRLKSQAPQALDELADLCGAHEGLGKLTQHLCDEARREASEAESSASNGSFANLLSLFLGSYREHMRIEEKSFFPAAVRELSKEDFAILDFQIFDQPDPLVTEDMEDQFQALKNEIAKLARQSASKKRPTKVQLSDCVGKFLHAITSVEEFNEVLENERLHLTRHDAGGYELSLKGRWLMDIEDCSDDQAIWSVYYFLKGIEKQEQLESESA